MGPHLAQVNVGRWRAPIERWRAPIESPRLAGAMAELDPVSAMGDGAPGFIEQLRTKEGKVTSVGAVERNQARGPQVRDPNSRR
jgi:hypothetical protein